MSKYKYICGMFTDNEDGYTIDCDDMAEEYNKLAKQTAELKAENERLKKYETIYYLNQLQASNEDIDKFKQNQIQQSINISDLLKDNTKQVCEYIKQEVKKLIESKDFGLCNHEYANGYCYGLQYDLAKILDKIQD